MKVWVVRKTDPKTLAEIVVLAREDRVAIEEGRVFVGKKRVTKDQPVSEGDQIKIGPRIESPRIEILFDRDDVIACVKPAGLPSVPDHAGAAHSLVALVEKQLGVRALRVTSRLDREVSGVVLFAKTEAAENRLANARTQGNYHRHYVAIAIGHGNVGDGGRWEAPIGRAKDPLLRRVDGDEPKPALTHWSIVATTPNCVWLDVHPKTGRTHQIRVHAAHAGLPLVGDRDYGPGRFTRANGAVVDTKRIALHAKRVAVAGLEAVAPVPRELADLWRACGGDVLPG